LAGFAALAEQAQREVAQARQATARFEARLWGGHPPTDRLRGVAANTIGLARLDRALLDALAQAQPEQQRTVARWAAHRACEVSRLDTVEWVTAALAAVERGDPLPPPFDDQARTWQRLWADPRVPATVVTSPDGTPNCSQQAMALPAVFAAVHPDPLVAAVDALYAAAIAHGPAHTRLFGAARAAFLFLAGRPPAT
jgi:hypothetical protein